MTLGRSLRGLRRRFLLTRPLVGAGPKADRTLSTPLVAPTSALALLLACHHAPSAPVAPAPVATEEHAAQPAPARQWPAADADAPPNILVLVIDDMGVDKQSIYGEHPHPSPTPTLDALAARSVVFRNAWASPGCTPSRSAAMTGRYARRTGAGVPAPMNGQPWELPLDETTLPEMLKSAPVAWSSAMIGKWHLSTNDSPHGFRDPLDQGFDRWRGSVGNLNAFLQTEGRPQAEENGYFHWLYVDDSAVPHWNTTYATTQTVDDALEILPELKPPWLAWVAPNAVHVPLDVPPLSLWSGDAGEPRTPARYDAVAGALDTELARFFRGIPADVLARTWIVCFGDNGTPGHAIRPPANPSHGKMTMYEGGLNVPLYVSGPGVTPGFSNALVSLVDLFPTVAEIAHVDLSALRDSSGAPVALDGRSLLPWVRDPSAAGPDTTYMEFLAPNGPPPWKWVRSAARDSRYKLVIDELHTEHLYDLAGRDDDGPDLMTAGPPLTDEQKTALARLEKEVARHDVPWGH